MCVCVCAYKEICKWNSLNEFSCKTVTPSGWAWQFEAKCQCELWAVNDGDTFCYIHIHTYTHIYIYTCVYIYIFAYNGAQHLTAAGDRRNIYFREYNAFTWLFFLCLANKGIAGRSEGWAVWAINQLTEQKKIAENYLVFTKPKSRKSTGWTARLSNSPTVQPYGCPAGPRPLSNSRHKCNKLARFISFLVPSNINDTQGQPHCWP